VDYAAASAGTVSSVGISGPSIITWSNTPVSTSGTLTGVLNNQSANTFLAGPISGGATIPTFRVFATADFVAPTVQVILGNPTGAANRVLHLMQRSGQPTRIIVIPLQFFRQQQVQ
jgi:hypothetical protein